MTPFLRPAPRHKEARERAERLDALADYGAQRLAAKGLAVDDVPAVVKRVLPAPKKT